MAYNRDLSEVDFGSLPLIVDSIPVVDMLNREVCAPALREFVGSRESYTHAVQVSEVLRCIREDGTLVSSDEVVNSLNQLRVEVLAGFDAALGDRLADFRNDPRYMFIPWSQAVCCCLAQAIGANLLTAEGEIGEVDGVKVYVYDRESPHPPHLLTGGL